jgi:hypothetical protein
LCTGAALVPLVMSCTMLILDPAFHSVASVPGFIGRDLSVVKRSLSAARYTSAAV